MKFRIMTRYFQANYYDICWYDDYFNCKFRISIHWVNKRWGSIILAKCNQYLRYY